MKPTKEMKYAITPVGFKVHLTNGKKTLCGKPVKFEVCLPPNQRLKKIEGDLCEKCRLGRELHEKV